MLPAASLVAEAAANTDADADNDRDHYKSNESTYGILCCLLACFLPFSIPFVPIVVVFVVVIVAPAAILPNVIVRIAKRVSVFAYTGIFVRVVWALTVVSLYFHFVKTHTKLPLTTAAIRQ